MSYDGTDPSVTASGIVLSSVASAEADWQARISDPGVMWYAGFEHDDEVTRWRKPDTTADRLFRVASGGPRNRPFMRSTIPPDTGAAANSWHRPLCAQPTDPSFPNTPSEPGYAGQTYPFMRWGGSGVNAPINYQHGYFGHPDYHANGATGNNGGVFHGHEHYIQFSVRVPPERWAGPAHNGGKIFWLRGIWTTHAAEWILSSRSFGMMEGNTGFGDNNGAITREPQVAQSGVRRYFQAGGNYQINSCSTAESGQIVYSGCWTWPGYLGATEWVTFLVRTRLGHHAGGGYTDPAGQDGTLEVWQALNGAYIPIVRRYNVATYFDPGNPHGHQSILCGGYYNGLTWPDGFNQDFAEIIFSTAWIPPPSVNP